MHSVSHMQEQTDRRPAGVGTWHGRVARRGGSDADEISELRSQRPKSASEIRDSVTDGA